MTDKAPTLTVPQILKALDPQNLEVIYQPMNRTHSMALGSKEVSVQVMLEECRLTIAELARANENLDKLASARLLANEKLHKAAQMAEKHGRALQQVGSSAGVAAGTDLHTELPDIVRALHKDAMLYRALRKMHWNAGPLAVVTKPQFNVKLGADCPSGDRLDQAIREAMEANRDPSL